MDSDRLPKRRKLDTPGHRPSVRSANAPLEATPSTPTKEPAHERDDPAAVNGAKVTLSAAEVWAQAKAKSRAGGIKSKDRAKSNDDVYDDIEGAHAGRATSRKKTHTGSERKSRLDPLRNQKIGPASSPLKAAHSKDVPTLDFFKQFHHPAAASALKSTESVQAHRRPKISLRNVESNIVTEETRDSPDENLSRSGPQESSAQLNGAQPVKPKKTFEDEIRDLEKAAQQEAVNEENGQQLATKRTPRRNAGKASSRKGVQEKSERPRKRNSVKHGSVKPVARQKAVHGNVEDEVEERDAGERAMQVNSSEVARPPRQKSSPLLAASPKHIPTPPGTKALTAGKTTHVSIGSTIQRDQLSLIQTILLEKATGRRPVRLSDLDDEYTKVSTLVTQTITAGESNSMLLIGARGSGKSALVNQILREQGAQHPAEFLVVRLNGFIHTDDKIALREIWRQLGRGLELDEEESSIKNYADTLTTLLALLSHPAELGRDQADQVTKSVVFILDEFDLFVSHPRQTLLYNLFDIAQSRKAPIAVLGLTTKVGVAENLEKRVKSRFSHRYVHLSLAKSFAAFSETCKNTMIIHVDDLAANEKALFGVVNSVSAKLEEASTKRGPKIPDTVTTWNAIIEDVFCTVSLTKSLQRLYYTTKSVPDFLSSLLVPIATFPAVSAIDSNDLLEHLASGLSAPSLRAPDSKLDSLSSLSSLQLALLIAAARQSAIHDSDTVSFALAYEEYKLLASKAKLQASAAGALAAGAGSRVSGKEVAKGAWEELLECGLVISDGRSGGRVDVALEEIGMSGVDLGAWGRWCKEI